ncbi:MAG: DNA mismatch repair endonuclease MutL [Rikenellaceae bacterium]
MLDRIKLLPEKVANQIAAGEVVVRPSSVVKEMMENTIDAGATEVVVNYREGGFDLIQIVDNGCGMSPNDARMAFDRHATSKISSVDDIYALRTFGFRGEALASIGAVARVELHTRREGDTVGTITEVHGGDFISQTTAMTPVGSKFMVRELFYNLPVRRKFASKPNVSANQIKAEFKRVALCYPSIRFELYGNDAPLYSLSPSSLASRIVDVVGRNMKQNLLEISADTSIVKINGYIGRPSAATKKNSDQYLFVNGRFFRSASFTKAIMKGYEKLIPEGSNPSFFLFLEVEPDNVDVNVHPQKTEVKFSDEDSIWQIINAATRESLAKSGAVPMMEFDDIMPIEIPVAQKGVSYAEPKSNSQSDYNPFREDYINGSVPDVTEDFTGFDVPYKESAPKSTGRLRDSGFESVEIFESRAFAADDESTFDIIESTVRPSQMEFESVSNQMEPTSFNFLSTLPGGYIAAMIGTELAVVDARRAKERLLFDYYMKTLTSGSTTSQQLLFGQRLILSMSEYEIMEQNATEFAMLGFDIDYCGCGVIEVKGVPANESTEQIDTLIYDILKLVASPCDVEQQHKERLAETMARSGARRIGKQINSQEGEELLKQLSTASNVSYSPSGKEIFWKLSTEDIKHKLG